MNLLIILGMKKQLKPLKFSKLLFKSINRGGVILPLVLLILLFSSCGIAVPAYLNPPVKLANLSFYHAYNNNPNNALGYEFFYRIYDDNTIIDTATVISEADTFFTENNLLELLYTNRALINDSYYKRILPVSDDLGTNYNISGNSTPTASSPLMLVDPLYFDESTPSLRFQVYLNISPTTGEGEITTIGYSPAGSYPRTIIFKRFATEDDIVFNDVTFKDINIDQDDVPSELNDSIISVVFFVVLYGLTDQFVSIFSDVLYIGSINGLIID